MFCRDCRLPAQQQQQCRRCCAPCPSRLHIRSWPHHPYRLTLDQLAPLDPSTVVFVSVSSSTAACSEATELGCCACEHLPARAATAAALQALALQAVASAAAAARRAAGLPSPLVVGYVMKESRQLALGQQGMLPLLPGGMPAAGAQGAPSAAAAAAAATRAHAAPERSLCFVPLDLASPLAPQLRRCHMVLQKLTDCLQPGGGSGAVAAFTAEAAALLAYLEGERQRAQQTGTAGATAAAAAPRRVPPCLVDPAAALLPVMDRAALVQHLEAAVAAVRQQAIPMRAPASLLLQSFDPSATPRQLAAVGVGMPCIVKPRAACGVAEAHQMAFVLHGWVRSMGCLCADWSSSAIPKGPSTARALQPARRAPLLGSAAARCASAQRCVTLASRHVPLHRLAQLRVC